MIYLGVIESEVKNIFLSLPPDKLDIVFRRYGREHGSGALAYARNTYYSWKSGYVRMSGMVARRLLESVPPALEPTQRFELVKKLRDASLRKQRKYVNCQPAEWRSRVAPIVAELISASHNFQIPDYILGSVRWLADGDVAAAQRLLAAAEQEEAVVRLRHLEAEFRRIDFLLQTIETTRSVSHTIELPQGTIHVSITIPRKGFWRWLSDALS